MAPFEPLRVTSRTRHCFGPNARNLSRPLANPTLQCRRDWSPPPPAELELPASDDMFQTGGSSSSDNKIPGTKVAQLHIAVWLADAQKIESLLEGGADVNAEDVHRVTPLMLAVELMPRASEYFRIVELLLQKGANPRIRSSSGWSPLDEGVSRGDGHLVAALFEAAQKDLRERWNIRLQSVARSLLLLPDFECRIRWEFDSPVIPLLNVIAPSDTVRVRKCGSSLRLDSTLASWKRYRLSKRRNLTTLFVSQDHDAGSNACHGLFMVNHDKQTVVDVTEGLDGQEAAAIVADLVSADAMQCDMSINSLEVAEGTTWLGQVAGPCDVNGWSCLRYDVRGELGMTVRKKGCRIDGMTFQEYFGCTLPADACLPELRQEFTGIKQQSPGAAQTADASFKLEDDFNDTDSSVGSEVLEHWPGEQSQLPAAHPTGTIQDSSNTPMEPVSGPSKVYDRDKMGKTNQRVSGSVWLARDFPIPMARFLPVLEALAVEHDAARRLKEIVESPSLQEAAKQARESAEESRTDKELPSGHVFPVRAAIPINLAIRAILHFEAFELTSDFNPKDFELPQGYQPVSRSAAQKTPNRAKKRMLVANLAL